MSTDAQHPEPVVIAAFDTVGEAEVAQAMLRAEGIESLFDDQYEGGVLPVEGRPGAVLLEVRAQDAHTARLILGDAVGAEPPAAPSDG